MAGIADRGALRELPGVGDSIGVKIEDIVRTGTCADYDRLAQEIPHGLLQLTTVDGIGPKTARQLWLSLGVDSLEKLEAAAKDGRVAKVPGMGEKKQAKLLRALELRKDATSRLPFYRAKRLADPLVAAMRALGWPCEAAGSVRRWSETVGDVDFLVAATSHEGPTKAFLQAFQPEAEGRGWGSGGEAPGNQIAEVLGSGETRTSLRLLDGFRVDLRVVAPETWGAALLYFTGSKGHNIRLRQIAIQQGMKLSEYGLFREKNDVRIAGATEEEVYEALGLPFVPPEIREDQGEIEWALEGKVPDLIKLSDIKGDLHAHTDESDGAHALDVVAQAAKAKGYEYIAITDHTQSLTIAKGLDPARVDAQARRIREWNASHDESFQLLHGTESDIHEDGTLDLPDETLAKLDFVVGSLHGKLKMPKEAMTERVVRALAHPAIDVMGHPTARLLPDREPVEVDFDKVLEVAKKSRTALELNASANRMDLSAAHCRRAKEAGVKVVISTDAHVLRELDQMEWGIHQARRGWLGKKDVLNTKSRKELLEYVQGAA